MAVLNTKPIDQHCPWTSLLLDIMNQTFCLRLQQHRDYKC